MKGIHDFDWNAAGHMALDVVGFVWDGADWLNAAWYALEGNYEQAAVSALCALPGAGMALGGKMMGSQKLHKAGRVIFAISAGVAGGMGMSAGYSLMKTGVTNISNGLEEGRIDLKGVAQVFLGSTIACLSGGSMYCNFKGLLSVGDNLARSSRISETASETMESGKGCKGSTNAAEPPSAYGKGHDIETNGFGPDTGINRNINYGLKAADPSYGVSNKLIGSYELEINTPSRSSYVTGTSRTGMAAGAEENIWLKAGNGTGVSGTPGRKVSGSLGSTGLDVGKPKVPDVPEIWGRGGTAKEVPVSKPTYTQKIKWGIHEVDVRPEGNGFWGQRVRQSDSRVDAYELKINPQNESFYLQHPDGGYVQFENMINGTVQDGKLIMQQKSFYHVYDMPDFAKSKVLEEAQRQIEAASMANYKVEWLVSDTNAVNQLTKLFKENNINIAVTYHPE